MRHPAVINRRGSPPRAWGQSVIHVALQRRHRFTPTGVGTIGGRRITATLAAVHPHGRGDNYTVTTRYTLPSGSPPRAWGQSVVQIARQRRHRFTPTGVGTISLNSCAIFRRAVHPHGRGDNHLPRALSMSIRGSPPRAWGQSVIHVALQRFNRFTPTGVGTMSRACVDAA